MENSQAFGNYREIFDYQQNIFIFSNTAAKMLTV
jgi:hypothetical protein